MYQFAHGKTESVQLNIKDIEKLIEKYKEYKRDYFNELNKNRDFKERIENKIQELKNNKEMWWIVFPLIKILEDLLEEN